jgi:hypothetical protein
LSSFIYKTIVVYFSKTIRFTKITIIAKTIKTTIATRVAKIAIIAKTLIIAKKYLNQEY